ncbi:MAG: Ribonuclease Y [Mycoplasmataceae bacterium]|nr:MAG: Ribonuclease Y [Mycoplasmataceae bacterium]
MDFLQWLRSGYGYLLIFLTSFLIILFLAYFAYLKIIKRDRLELKNLIQNQKKQEKKLKIKERKIENFRNQLEADKERIELIEKRLKLEEIKTREFSDQLFRKEELFIQQLSENSKKEKNIQEQMEKIKRIKEQVMNELEEAIPMNKEEAKKILFNLLKKEVEQDLERYKEEKIRKTEKEIDKESTKIICQALEKCSSELVFTKTTDTLQLENQQIISKIIGKEGRNINSFQQVTGTEIIIDKESDEPSVQISSFNSLRRAIALQTLSNLVKEGRISPLQIEKTYQKVSSEIDEFIVKVGKEVLKELELNDVHPELIKHLGSLKYRTSYGQNVLKHCLEVAKIAGTIAAELNLDILLARRTGLFHDIGKSVEDGGNLSHVLSGISLAKKYQEPEEVINAIASHHRDFPPNNMYSLIILAADKLSAARPGARGYQQEAYLERMNNLENIANEFPGVKKSYAFQSGREVWVFADSEKLNDHKTWETARKIREKIKSDIIIPGEVTIYVIREKRFVQKLNNLKEISKPKKRKN